MATETKVPHILHTDTVQEHKLLDTQQFVQRFKDLFNQQLFSDIILRVGDHCFYAHRFILITASSVFDAMLNGCRWKEATASEIRLYEEDDCIPEFEQFLRYIYCGEADVKTTTVLPLLLLADKYEVTSLHQSCVKFMIDNIVQSTDTNRVLSWNQYAQMTGQSYLRDTCFNYIVSNFDIVMESSDWPFVVESEMLAFLQSSEMVVYSESTLWSRVETWLLHEHNKDKVEKYLGKVLPYMRFMMIPPRELLQVVEQSTLFLEHKECFSDALNSAYRKHSLSLDDCVGGTAFHEVFDEYRNYLSEEYGISCKFNLPDFANVEKLRSRIHLDCNVRNKMVNNGRERDADRSMFTVYFYPHGYFTTLTIYGNYLGRQNEDVTLKVVCRCPLDSPMKVDVTLVLCGQKNDVKYVAYTHTWSMVFSAEQSTFSADKFLDREKLLEENCPYMVGKNLNGAFFVKIQDIGKHLAENKPKE